MKNKKNQNKFLFAVLLLYAGLMLSVINWGTPNLDHPFTYNMDEWHQLQAVRTTFKDLSANVPGSAHGTMLHFILSGIYLIPFYLFGIINPFAITSSVDFLNLQQQLFEILRLNTLIFGLLSIFFISKIAKEHLKINQNIAIILFTVSPLWLALSNYFKYDIALIFWIVISLHYLLKFAEKPNLRNYLIAGAFCSLAVATKISAFPLFIAYIISFFWFNKKGKRKFNAFFLGLLIFFALVIILGIPDLVLGKGDWGEFLYSNLVSGTTAYANLITGFDKWWQYWLLKIFPLDFGYGFIAVYFLGLAYWIILFVKSFLNHKLFFFKKEFFLLFCFIIFFMSLIPLKLGANGNRLLVLLPFLALLSSSFLQRIKGTLINYKFLFAILFLLIFIIQSYQSMILIYIKWLPDVRQTSSQWMKENVEKNTLIGIENIPIYQLLPDIIVKEFYSKDRNYDYRIIDISSKTIPSLVIITNKELDANYFRDSAKKQLLRRLTEEDYREVVEFKPPKILYLFAGNELNYSTSGLAPISSISVFKKLK